MTELTELLAEVSPSLRVGWILWLSTGLALVAWFRLARATPLPVAHPLTPDPVVLATAPQEDPAAVPVVPEARPQESERRTRKSRSLRRKVD
jgi:hypothetical protein